MGPSNTQVYIIWDVLFLFLFKLSILVQVIPNKCSSSLILKRWEEFHELEFSLFFFTGSDQGLIGVLETCWWEPAATERFLYILLV